MINFIAENEKHKVYSLDESVYLKDKSKSENEFTYSENDLFIGWHYGNPNDGIITKNHVIVSGCGITIYDLENQKEKHLLENETNRFWTNGIHQDEQDDQLCEFRFVSWNSDNKIRVFKMNILTEEFIELN